MGLTLKTYAELKLAFDKSVNAICLDDAADSVEKLKNPKRSQQILLIRALFNHIEADKATESPSSIKIIYGAMLAISAIIKAEGEKGRLYTALIDNLGLNQYDDKKQNIVFSDEFQLQLLSAFNNYILNAYQARNIHTGIINLRHFSSVPPKDLDKLLKKSFLHEQTVSDKIIQSLTNSKPPAISDKKTEQEVAAETTTPPTFTQSRPDTIDMTAYLTFIKLSEKLIKIEEGELSHHHKSTAAELHTPRAQQLQFLSTLASNLKKTKSIDDHQKAIILYGAAYIVRGQITQEYSKSSTISIKSISSSVLHTSLSETLRSTFTPNNYIEYFVAATLNYLEFVYLEPIPDSDKKAIKATHPFSTIKKFNLNVFLSTANQMIYDCRVVLSKTVGNQPSYSKQVTNFFIGNLTQKSPVEVEESVALSKTVENQSSDSKQMTNFFMENLTKKTPVEVEESEESEESEKSEKSEESDNDDTNNNNNNNNSPR